MHFPYYLNIVALLEFIPLFYRKDNCGTKEKYNIEVKEKCLVNNKKEDTTLLLTYLEGICEKL